MHKFWQREYLPLFKPKRLVCSEFNMLYSNKKIGEFRVFVRQNRKTLNTAPDPLIIIDAELAALDLKLGLVAQLRPLNLQEERNKFFESESYEPKFCYKPLPKDLDSIKGRLENIEIPLTQSLGFLLEEKRVEMIKKVELIRSVGDDLEFPVKAEKFFGIPPEHVIRMAALELGKSCKSKNAGRSYSTDDAVRFLQDAMDTRGLKSWIVKKKKGIISRCVIAKNNRIFIRAGERFSHKSLKKLITHEIEAHIYCHENGKLQPYQIFVRGTARSIRTQEGLAIFQQHHRFKSTAPSGLLGFHSALYAREHGFRAVYDELCRFVSPVKAWKMTARVKRGMSDTGMPGSTLKNIVYFWGYMEVLEFIKKGGKLKSLFIGKCAIDQLNIISEMEELVQPLYLPKLHF